MKRSPTLARRYCYAIYYMLLLSCLLISNVSGQGLVSSSERIEESEIDKDTYPKTLVFDKINSIKAICPYNNIVLIGGGNCIYICEISPVLKYIGVVCLSSQINDIQIINDYAYIGQLFGVSVLDISDLHNPVEISFYKINANNGNANNGVEKIRVDGPVAYVTARTGGLFVLDVSDPINMHELDEKCKINECCSIQMDLHNSRIIARMPRKALVLFDVANPNNIVELSKCPYNDIADIHLTSTLAYAAAFNEGMLIYNAANPDSLYLRSKYKIDVRAWSIAVDEASSTAYVSFDDGIRVFNVLNPDRPKQIHHIAKNQHVLNVIYYNKLLFYSESNKLVIESAFMGMTGLPTHIVGDTISPDVPFMVKNKAVPASPAPANMSIRHPGDLFALFETSMNEAERCTPERVAQFIAEGADPNFRVKNYVGDPGNTPLRLALAVGVSAETIKALLEGGADPGSSEYLVLAFPDTIRIQLLIDAGTPINGPLPTTEPNGWSALMMMAYHSNNARDLEALKFMIAAGADAAHKAPDGKSAYSLALDLLKKTESYNASIYLDGIMPDWETASLATKRTIIELLKTSSEGRPLSSTLNAGQQLPVPFIDRDVCPWEGCKFGRWIADMPDTAYAVEGEPTQVAFQLAQDESYIAETGNMWIHSPGLVLISKAVELESPVDRSATALALSPGDTLAVLTRLGEGRYHVWRDNTIYLVQSCWGTKADLPNSEYCGTLIDNGDSEWWVRVHNNSGMVGWIRMSSGN